MQRLQSCRLGVRSIPPSPRLPNLRSAYIPIPPRASLDSRITRIRTLTSTAFRLSTPVQKTPITSVKDEIIAPAPPAPSSILDRLPAFAKPIKPYLDLTRIDKPIGTLLLYWPCGEPRLHAFNMTNFSSSPLVSMVHHNGIDSKSSPDNNTSLLPRVVRDGCGDHARSGMYHQ
jgi:hypothetical protein